MSYCRNNGTDSDVYVIATANAKTQKPGWWCCGCDFENNFFETRPEMVEHLLQHRREGDKVPDRALERLRREIAAG
jgi:hypothetical protein